MSSPPDEPAARRRGEAETAPTPEEVERLKARLPPRERDKLERDLDDVARGDQWAW